jgi:hypothetical protein
VLLLFLLLVLLITPDTYTLLELMRRTYQTAVLAFNTRLCYRAADVESRRTHTLNT